MTEYMCNTSPGWDKSVYAEKLHVNVCTPRWQFKSKEQPKKAIGSPYCSTRCEALGLIMYKNYHPFWVIGKGVGYKKNEPATKEFKCEWSDYNKGPGSKWDEVGAAKHFQWTVKQVRKWHLLEKEDGYPFLKKCRVLIQSLVKEDTSDDESA